MRPTIREAGYAISPQAERAAVAVPGVGMAGTAPFLKHQDGCMTLFRTVEPAAEPVTLADVKAHLQDRARQRGRAAGQGLIRAAREDLERATGIALIDQSWRLALDHWPSQGCALLTRPSGAEVLSVTAFGTEGEASLIDPDDYQLDTLSGRRGCISRRGRSRCASSTASRSIFPPATARRALTCPTS